MRHLLSPAGSTALAALLLLGACGDVDGDPQTRLPSRPAIDATEARCGPVEVVPMGRAERFLKLPDGDLAVLGNSFNRFREASGKMVRFDPTGQRTAILNDIGWSLGAFTWTDQGLVTGRLRPVYYRWTDMLEEVERFGAAYDLNDVTALELVPMPDGHIISGATGPAGGVSTPALVRIDPATREPVWTSHFTTQDGQPAVSGQITSLVGLPGGWVTAVGSGRSVEDGVSRHGFVFSVETRHGLTVTRKTHPQEAFEPLRVVLDRQQRPVVLAIDGHEGPRYESGRPYLARIDDDGELVDRIDVPLPADVTHGALLAGIELEDGWLLGGAVCGENRSWCQAWVVKLDSDGDIAWSRRTTRDVASTVTDLHVGGGRLLASLSSSQYCCEFDELDYDAWIWELDLDGGCPSVPTLRRDGRVFR